MINIDYSFLLTPTSSNSFGGGGGGAAPARATPQAPWSSKAKPPAPGELLRLAMSPRPLVDVGKVKAGLPGAEEDYAELFALHHGVTALEALAQRMDAKGVSASERAQIERRFLKGVQEVGGFIDRARFDHLKLVHGSVSERARSSGGVPRDKPQYTTGVMHRGGLEAPVAGLDGPAEFMITVSAPPLATSTGVTTTPPPPKQIAIDLAAIGAPDQRTLTRVVSHLNQRMKDEDVLTRFETVKVPQEPRTVKVGDKTITLPAGPDQWSLRVVGVAAEVLTFAAPARADAVYLAQTAGKAIADTPTSQTRELLKFQADGSTGTPSPSPRPPGETNWPDGKVFGRAMDPDIAAVRASAAAADGSVYMLAELTGEVAGQTIKGQRDVALLKYDSAGQLLYSRTLGAAEAATASAIAVSADGKVAIGGAVTGVLRDAPSSTSIMPAGSDLATASVSLNPGESDSFVTVFDDKGVELWTRRGGAVGEDGVKALAWGADGSVYAAGQTRGAMPGMTGEGGQDGWIRGYDASGKLSFTRQFGAGGTDGAAALAIDGSNLVVAGVENGQAVLRRWDLSAAGGPALTATRNLGSLAGGTLAGLSVENGRITLAGTTRSGALEAGSENTAFSGGKDAFVASLDAGLAADAGDRISYWGGSGEEEVSAVTFQSGQAWITGSSTADVGSLAKIGARDGFIARIDAATGAVGWSRRFTAKDGEAAPSAIAVAQGGASVLDRLGLPSGTIQQSGSQSVTAATSARAGDRFYIKAGDGRPAAVTLEATDTLKTLASKVSRALGFAGKVEVVKDGQFERLLITPRNAATPLQITAGESGRDLLESLGLNEGRVRKITRDKDGEEVGGKTYGLNLARDLSVASKAEIKRTLAELSTARTVIRTAYTDLVSALTPGDDRPKITGTAPAHMQAQLANYQAGLNRLTGGR